MVPYLHLSHRLLGAWSVLVLLMAFQVCQIDNDFLLGAGLPVGGLIFSFNTWPLPLVWGGLLGVPDPLETFILPVPFLITVGTLILP
jgi:hypothetical protein